jgi:hypothetical protein
LKITHERERDRKWQRSIPKCDTILAKFLPIREYQVFTNKWQDYRIYCVISGGDKFD